MTVSRTSTGNGLRNAKALIGSPRTGWLGVSRQVLQHDLAGSLGLDKRPEGRTADLDGGSILIDWTPRNYKASISMKTRATAVLITDHEGKAATARLPYLNVFDRSNDAAELHAAPNTARVFHPAASRHCLGESENAGALT